MSEFDLSTSIASARDAVASAAERYVAVQEQAEAIASELSTAQQKLKRLERALAILNGEEEPVTSAPAAVGATAPATTPAPAAATATAPAPPPPKKPQPQGPFAAMACGACNEVGTYSEQYRPTKAGTLARLLVCGECGNEQYLG